MAAAGFQLDQLLAACEDFAKRTRQEKSEQQKLQQCQTEQGLEALAEDSDDGDDLYADLQQPEGAITSQLRQEVKMYAHTSALCAAGLALFSGSVCCCWAQVLLLLGQAVSSYSSNRSRYSR
jgi:hypothetical protein